jgi:hypothetical protein
MEAIEQTFNAHVLNYFEESSCLWDAWDIGVFYHSMLMRNMTIQDVAIMLKRVPEIDYPNDDGWSGDVVSYKNKLTPRHINVLTVAHFDSNTLLDHVKFRMNIDSWDTIGCSDQIETVKGNYRILVNNAMKILFSCKQYKTNLDLDGVPTPHALALWAMLVTTLRENMTFAYKKSVEQRRAILSSCISQLDHILQVVGDGARLTLFIHPGKNESFDLGIMELQSDGTTYIEGQLSLAMILVSNIYPLHRTKFNDISDFASRWINEPRTAGHYINEAFYMHDNYSLTLGTLTTEQKLLKMINASIDCSTSIMMAGVSDMDTEHTPFRYMKVIVENSARVLGSVHVKEMLSYVMTKKDSKQYYNQRTRRVLEKLCYLILKNYYNQVIDVSLDFESESSFSV